MSIKPLVEEIIVELERIENAAPLEINNGGIPGFIAVDNEGNGFHTSNLIEANICSIAHAILLQSPNLKQKFTQADWEKHVRKIIGYSLGYIDMDNSIEINTALVLNHLSKNVHTYDFNFEREIAFGCTLFNNNAIEPFSIGPVKFESRHIWLARQHTEKRISALAKKRIEQAWLGKKLRKRKGTFDSVSESNIIATLGKHSFVCTVVNRGHAAASARKKGLLAIRLAITSLALLWPTPSKALKSMRTSFDPESYSQLHLNVFEKGIFFSSYRLSLPYGECIETKNWNKAFAKHQSIRQTVSEVLDYVISPTETNNRPKIMSTLAHALSWFYKGCREEIDHFSVVYFAACLDALACGEKARGIIKLIEVRLGLEPNQFLFKNGATVKQFVNRVYSDGRSRTIHGNNNELRNDWTDIRNKAERLCQLCLLTCLDWAAKNTTSDNPQCLSQCS